MPVDGFGEDVAAGVDAEVPGRDADPHPGRGGVPVGGAAAVAGRPGPGAVPRAGRRRVRGAAAAVAARHGRGVAVLTGPAAGDSDRAAAVQGHRSVPVVVGGPRPGLVGWQIVDARRRGVIGVALVCAVLVLARVALRDRAGFLPRRVVARRVVLGPGKRHRSGVIGRTVRFGVVVGFANACAVPVLVRVAVREHPSAAMRRVGDDLVS